MKKLLLTGLFFFLISLFGISQIGNVKQYHTDLNCYAGKLEIKKSSDYVIQYSLFIFDKSGKEIFKQDSYAINTYFGSEYGDEEIENKEGKLVTARQYFELCKCNEYFTLKISRDFSVVKIDCTESFIKKLFGGPVNSLKTNQSLGNFY